LLATSACPRIAPVIKVYQYSKCSTCRKALAFLDRAGVEYEAIDIVTRPPSKKELKEALARTKLPLKKLFNTSGQSYREGGFGERFPDLSETEAIAALNADGKLVKRPLVLGSDFALVGFDEAEYRERFG
jgi:Spx/MgsR family transcriptional regulator